MANNQLMLQQLFSGWSLWGVEHATQTGERGVWGGVTDVCKCTTLLTKLGSLLRQASTNSLSGLL